MAFAATLIRSIKQPFKQDKPLEHLPSLLESLNVFVAEVSSFSQDANSAPVVDVLRNVYEEDYDHGVSGHTEVFLDILYALEKILPTASIISTWFELILAPSLKDSTLPPKSIQHAQALILKGLKTSGAIESEKVIEFQQRFLEIYFSEFGSYSPVDVLQNATLNTDERESRSYWKINMESIIMTFFATSPDDFLRHMRIFFNDTAWRFQAALLLVECVSPTAVESLLNHPILEDVLMSLLIDTSSSLFDILLSIQIRLLPYMVLHTPQRMRSLVPSLFLVLYKVLCWRHSRKRGFLHDTTLHEMGGEKLDAPQDARPEAELDEVDFTLMQLHPNVNWQRMEPTLDNNAMTTHPETFFCFLIGLFPCNTLYFLRSPARYLADHPCEQLFEISWEQLIDYNQLRMHSLHLLSLFRIPPMILLFDDNSHLEELQDLTRWKQHTAAMLIEECIRLDLTSIALGSSGSLTISADDRNTPPISKVSVPDILATTTLLKSGGTVEFVGVGPLNSTIGGIGVSASASQSTVSLSSSILTTPDIMAIPEIADTMYSLQKEAILLRNELNFELWLKQHFTQCFIDKRTHANHCHRDTETEILKRQNTLAKYRRRYGEIQHEFKNHMSQANAQIGRLKIWKADVDGKLSELRKKERGWSKEAAGLRDENKTYQATIRAQNILLEDAKREAFTLKTLLKEVQPKIDRVHDYEKKIEQMSRLQQLWDADVQRFNAQSDQMHIMISDYSKMQLQVKSLQAANEKLQLQFKLSHFVSSREGSEKNVNVRQSDLSQEMVQKLLVKVKELEEANRALSLSSISTT